MKTRLLFLLLFLGIMGTVQAQVSINEDGNDPHTSAMLDISSTDKGLLIPRLTSAERMAVVNPANGLMIFDISSNTFWFYSQSTNQWEEMGGAIVSALNDLLDAKTDANSIYVGYTSGQSNDGNNFNTSMGSKSMRDNTAGSHNIALGYRSLTNNTTGNNNVALGENSLAGTITGNQNTVIGKNAGASIGENASGNIFLGYEAGKTEDGSNKLIIENSDSPNPLIGGDFDMDEVMINGDLSVSENLNISADVNAGQNLNVSQNLSTETITIAGGTPEQGKVLTSDDNGNATWENALTGIEVINDLHDATSTENSLYIGAEAGQNQSGSTYNVGVGQKSLRDNTSGKENTGTGFGSLGFNTTGNYNTGMGSAASARNESGNNNSAFGKGALAANTIGSDNTAVGTHSLLWTIGNQNTAIGSGAGQNSNNTSGNVFIGYEAGKDEDDSNKLYIENSASPSPLIGGDFDTDEVEINGDLDITGNTSINGNSTITLDLNINRDLHVDDSTSTQFLKITGGDPAQGKVLTSDDNGNAIWTETAAGATKINDLTDAKTYNTSLYLGSGAGQGSSGSQNISVGPLSLGHLTGGAFNVALGYMAGYTNGPEALSGNVFIGNYAGMNMLDNNQLIIENENGATPLIHGSFSDDHLKINGTLQITGGNPEEGKVLVSDANGKASWEYAAGAQDINDLSDAKTVGQNVYLGYNSGQDDNANSYSTGVGFQSLSHNTGVSNSALGNNALYQNTTGHSNTAVGKSSLSSNTEGYGNVGVGSSTMSTNGNGNMNTAIGSGAGGSGYGDKTGSVFIGYKAGFNETEDNKLYIENSDSSSPLIGGDFSTDEVIINGTLEITGGNPGDGKVLVSDADGKASWKNAAGAQEIDGLSDAMSDNSSIYLGTVGGADAGNTNNTAVGISALNSNQIGTYNAAFGKNSLFSNNSGIYNSAFGAGSMELSTNGVGNTAIGSGALYNNGSGTGNTALGFEAGFGNYDSNSSGNVFLGYKAGYFETGSNKLYIDNTDTYYPLVYGDFTEKKLEVNGEFKVTNDSYSNVKINNEEFESNVPINAKSEVSIAGKLIAHNDIIISDDKNITYENARTGKLQLSGLDFKMDGFNSDIELYYEYSILTLASTNYTSFEISAPIKVPDNVHITKMTFNLGSNEGNNMDIKIVKKTPESIWDDGIEISSSNLTMGSTFPESHVLEGFMNENINNDNIYFIIIRGNLEVSDSYRDTMVLMSVSIEYEYLKLNH